MSDTIFILVHGTFSPDADWTEPNSKLRNNLRNSVSGSVAFEVYDWSGENSTKSRITAIHNFYYFIQEKIKSKYSNKKVILVGHSHGGSIITSVFSYYPEINNLISGVVTLNTPFFHAKKRSEISFLLSFFVSNMALLLTLPSVFIGISVVGYLFNLIGLEALQYFWWVIILGFCVG